MKTIILSTIALITLSIITLAIVFPPQAYTLDLQVYQVVCVEKDGSDQIYEYVAESQQSYEYEKEFCQHITSIK